MHLKATTSLYIAQAVSEMTGRDCVIHRGNCSKVADSLLTIVGKLIFGFWDGRNKDILRLIPFGIIYIALGFLIVTFKGGSIVQIIALLITLIGLIAVLVTRKSTQIRSWVTWIFIAIDLVIISALGMVLHA